jgi:hypothetical protein
MPDQVGDLPVADAEMMCHTGDAAQRIVGVGTGCIDLANDRMFGAGKTGQCRHRRPNTVTAPVTAHRVKGTRRIRKPQFGCLGEQFDDVVEAPVVDGGGVDVDEISQRQTVRHGEDHRAQRPARLLARMASRH